MTCAVSHATMAGMRKTLHFAPLLALPLLLSGCIAYSVGTTARPVPKNEFQKNLSVYVMPNGIESVDENGETSDVLTYSSADFEGRWGLSDRSDVGLRALPGGVIVNYKRLLNGANDPDRMAISAIGGTGIVNFGNHAYLEAGLIASGREDRHVPYGGVRAMHVLPISSGAVSDSPSVGLFAGLRLRINDRFSLSPELGVYRDEPALELRQGNIIVVPSITMHWD